MRWAMRRSCGLGGVVLLVALATSGLTPAFAHGEAEFAGDVGPYFVETFEELVPDTGMLYTIEVRDQSRGLPVRGLAVEVVATGSLSSVGPLLANELGDAYQVLVADPATQRWNMTVSIGASDAERFVFEHEIGLSDDRASQLCGWPIAIGAFALLVGSAALTLAGRRSTELRRRGA